MGKCLGALDQLGERKVRNLEARGSIPLRSTTRPVDDQWVYYFDSGLDAIRSYSFIREFEKACNELRACESYK